MVLDNNKAIMILIILSTYGGRFEVIRMVDFEIIWIKENIIDRD